VIDIVTRRPSVPLRAAPRVLAASRRRPAWHCRTERPRHCGWPAQTLLVFAGFRPYAGASCVTFPQQQRPATCAVLGDCSPLRGARRVLGQDLALLDVEAPATEEAQNPRRARRATAGSAQRVWCARGFTWRGRSRFRRPPTRSGAAAPRGRRPRSGGPGRRPPEVLSKWAGRRLL
jgi:hypothetical protein